MTFGTTPKDNSGIPLSSVYVPGTTGSNLTALQGGPASTDGNGQVSAPAAMSVADGADVTQGTSTDANTANTIMGRMTKIRDLLNATLVISGTITEVNSAAILADLNAIDTVLGNQADAAWSGSGNGSEIAILKKIVSELAATLSVSGTVTANAGTNLNTSTLALDATLAKLNVAQAAALGSNTGPMMQGSVTSSAPTYTTGNIDPLSLTTSGALRTDSSATIQPISGTVSANASQTGTWIMQPGNTANTTPWLATINQGGNSASVTGSNALKVDASATTQPISGTVMANQGGTWNVNNVSGTVSLPTGASISAKQPALGTAGSASTDVLSVQGIASMTALKVDGSGVTQPISGNVGIVAGSALIGNVELTDSGGTNKASISSGGALKVDGSAVTQPVSAASLPLPTGAATSAKQPALGTAGSASADVLTVQGITSMTPLKVDGSAVNQPVVLQSGGNLAGSVQIVGSDGSSKLKVNGTGTLPIVQPDESTSGTLTSAGTSVQFDLTDGVGTIQFFLAGTFSAGSTIVFEQSADNTNWVPMNGRITGSVSNEPISTTTGPGPIAIICNGVSAGHVRARCTVFQVADSINVTIRSSVGVAAIAINASLPAGTASIGAVTANAGTGSFTVAQPTGSNLHTVLDSGSTTAVTQATGTNLHTVVDSGSISAAQSGTWNVTNVSGTVSLPTGAATSAKQPALGTAGAASSDVLSVQGIASMTALKVDGSAVTQPVSGTVTADQGGTWTVQPGNTANTTPWLATINQGGNSASVTGSNALKVDGSAVTQPISGTVTANGILVSQGSTTAGENGALIQGAVTTAAPTYTTAQTNPLSLTTAGALRTDASATTQPVSGTVAATQSGTWTVQPGNTANTTAWKVDGSAVTQPVSAASLPLPTGSSTSAKQPALGTAGSASADVLTVQGITSMTALKVDGSAVTQPVSGTVTANMGTTNGLALDSSVNGLLLSQGATTSGEKGPLVQGAVTTGAPSYTTAQTSPLSLTTAGAVRVDASATTQPISGTVTANAGTNLNTSTLALESGGNLATLAGAVSSAKVQSNVAQINGVTPLMGNGTSGTGAQRVTIASDSTGQVALAAGSNVIGHVIADSGSTTAVTQATASNLNAQVVGAVASAGANAGNPVKVAGVFNTTQPTVTNGQIVDRQSTARGAQIVATGVDAFDIVINSITAALSQANQLPVSNSAPQGLLTLSLSSLTANSDNSITFSGGATVARRIRVQNESGATIYWNADATASSGSPGLASPASNSVMVEWINVQITTLHIFIPSGGTTILNGSGGVKVSAWA